MYLLPQPNYNLRIPVHSELATMFKINYLRHFSSKLKKWYNVCYCCRVVRIFLFFLSVKTKYHTKYYFWTQRELSKSIRVQCLWSLRPESLHIIQNYYYYYMFKVPKCKREIWHCISAHNLSERKSRICPCVHFYTNYKETDPPPPGK